MLCIVEQIRSTRFAKSPLGTCEANIGTTYSVAQAFTTAWDSFFFLFGKNFVIINLQPLRLAWQSSCAICISHLMLMIWNQLVFVSTLSCLSDRASVWFAFEQHVAYAIPLFSYIRWKHVSFQVTDLHIAQAHRFIVEYSSRQRNMCRYSIFIFVWDNLVELVFVAKA